MIVVKLMGGLGNQMFQYAAGRRLAYTQKTVLKLDLSGFNDDPLRNYSLNVLNIKEKVATPQEVDKFFRQPQKNRFSKLLAALGHKPGRQSSYTIFREHPAPLFIREILRAKENIYLEGYWQSEKYFQDIEEILRHEFKVMTSLNEKNKAILTEIQRLNSVCLHVRRGDYISNPMTNQAHGTCSHEYYMKAVELITDRVPFPHFFVFSDDCEWVKEHINLDFPTEYVTHNPPKEGHEDLRLMSHCKHFIIANSSFSWWGAWLSEASQKIVVAPDKWFQTLSPGANDQHIIPGNWIKL